MRRINKKMAESPIEHLPKIVAEGKKEVASPSKLTGFATLKKAQELRESFMGGLKKGSCPGLEFRF